MIVAFFRTVIVWQFPHFIAMLFNGDIEVAVGTVSSCLINS